MTVVLDTLFIRGLPVEFTVEEKTDLLKHFGAVKIRCMPDNGRMKNSAFATFHSEDAAEEALIRLHQLDVLGSRLNVQLARQHEKPFFPHQGDFKTPNLKGNENEKSKSKSEEFHKQVEAMQRNLNSLSMLFGLNYPINPKLRYSYPKPTETILANIVHALISVPKFYTQVLHLMNKFNLPPPFGDETISPPLEEDTYKKTKKIDKDLQSSESELDSDEEENKSSPYGTKRLKTSKRQLKRFKIQDLLHTMFRQGVIPTTKETTIKEKPEVFDTPDTQPTKRIEFKLNTESLPTTNQELNEKEKKANDSGFGQFAPLELPKDKDVDNENKDGETYYISREEIKKNKLSNEEMSSRPVFQNYKAGKVTSRLYIKNLDRRVKEVHLKAVYGYYVNEQSEEEKLRFDIRLMQEGRMKGQAFVTLPNEEKAKAALQDTNGFQLYDKPFVVQFGRSAKAKEIV